MAEGESQEKRAESVHEQGWPSAGPTTTSTAVHPPSVHTYPATILSRSLEDREALLVELTRSAAGCPALSLEGTVVKK